MLNLSHGELQSIVDSIRPIFNQTVQSYDSRKYPEDVYERLRRAFQSPVNVTTSDIRDALVWKYGHWGNRNYPQSHKDIIAKIQTGWTGFLEHQAFDARGIFDYWAEVLKEHQNFITVTFLTHLLCSDEIPIIDQHNFRAMNAFIKSVRKGWIGRKKPSRFSDILELKEFMCSVLEHWVSCEYPGAPNPRALDKFLMVTGQRLKQN